MPTANEELLALESLRRESRLITFAGGTALLAAASLLGFKEDWRQAAMWLMLSGLLWAYVCRTLWNLLALNRRRPSSLLYPDLGWGNRATILRGWLIALSGGFLLVDLQVDLNIWLPAAGYSLAAVLDRLDGFLARRGGQTSLLGRDLDIRCDALGLAVAPMLAIAEGRLHLSYLLMSAAFYVYRWGLRHRDLRGLPMGSPPDNPLRRSLAGFQMGFVAVALWPWLNAEFLQIAGIAFMLPVLFGFAVDWLVVVGMLSTPNYARLAEYCSDYLQPGLRLLLAGLVLSSFPRLLTTALMAMVLIGWAGRAAALGLLLCLGWPGLLQHESMGFALAVLAASWLLLLGTGRASVWNWGDAWIQRYDSA
jgi:CDP-diacylglycerol--glycerol-3-phosphate 3-phosphatidyltransferase